MTTQAYCTDVLHMSASTAWRRTRSAQAARQFPVILPMIADGKLPLSAVSLLATHLKPDNAVSLLAEATHKSKSEVELILARRFPRSDVPESVRALGDPNAVASPTAQVVANIAAQISPVTVVPADSSESRQSTDPLSAADESGAVRQVASQVIVATAPRCASETGPPDLQAVLERGLQALVESPRNTRCAARSTCATSGRHLAQDRRRRRLQEPRPKCEHAGNE